MFGLKSWFFYLFAFVFMGLCLVFFTSARVSRSVEPSLAGAVFWQEVAQGLSPNLERSPKAKHKVKTKREAKRGPKGVQSPSPKTQLAAFLLCLLLGVFGAHRFYTGYTMIGILQLLTLGCCGVFTLVDLIMIITGEFKTIDGQRLVPWTDSNSSNSSSPPSRQEGWKEI